MAQPNAAPLVVGIGEVLWDLLPGGKQLGGAPANFVYHAQALGGHSRLVSAVGADALGQEILERLEILQLDRSGIARVPDHPTGTVEVTLDAQGAPSYHICEQVAWDFIPESSGLASLARQTDIVCFGSLAQRGSVSRATIRRFLEATPSQALRILDINLRPPYFDLAIIKELLKLCNVLKFNDQELPVLAEMLQLRGDESQLLAHFLERYSLRMVALTRGGQGSRLLTSRESSDHPGFPTAIVDTVGAGDSFTAAMAMGLWQGRSLNEINVTANRLASYVCSVAGATPAIPESLRRPLVAVPGR